MIIAIDGPAASGKGTLGSRLAQHYGLRHLDTGLLYRAVAKAVIDAGKRPSDKAAAVAAARALDHAHLNRHALQADPIGTAASIVSAFPEVRAVLLQYQRAFAAEPPGAVLDGRDIGTVIVPEADVKIFLVASAEERARRRTLELERRGDKADFEVILADIKARDDRDTNRPISPLKQAPDAHLLDTTNMDISTAIRAAIDIVEATRAGRGRG
ncbi:MAG TPA: (d)CMP kinase [Pseudolabrys sp.]|nr:(d)CMP kinase [Pseudolabrys sp.]